MSEFRKFDPENQRQTERDNEESSKLTSEYESFSPIQDINKVFEECKFGRFHIRLLLTTFAGFIASILVTNSTSYLLPIAECDLDMNLRQKGLLTAMPFFGMLISSVISGFLIDTFGRIIFLKLGYGGLFFFTLLSASSQNYGMYAAAKFGEGVLVGIANTGIMSITSEFCHPTVRDRVMLCQSAFGAMAQIICPAMAWGILLQDWEWSFFGGSFVLKIWNFYLFAMSFWSFVGYFLYSTLPESPKFLVTQKKYLEAKNILVNVYAENTRKAPETFPYPNLWDQEILETTSKVTQKHSFGMFRTQVLIGLRNMKPMLQRPLISYLIILGTMQLVIVGIYDVLRLWFPQLSTIVEHYDLDASQNLCALVDNYTATEKLRIANSTLNSTEVCVPHISGMETYIDSIIIGLVCIVPYFISGVIVNKVGKKNLLILSGIICIGALLGIRWAQSKTMMVALFSVDVAIMQTMKSLTQMVLVEVFPTTIRSVAMSLVIVLSRIGTLIGNIGFPILLDKGCEVPFYSMAGMMICLIVLSMFTPKKKDT
ncbi:unnamed protein product [Arctia plantaginis]|nr:unnamed protein product [Arctia plantaginis]